MVGGLGVGSEGTHDSSSQWLLRLRVWFEPQGKSRAWSRGNQPKEALATCLSATSPPLCPAAFPVPALFLAPFMPPRSDLTLTPHPRPSKWALSRIREELALRKL